MMRRDLLTTEEAARYLGLADASSIRNYIRTGKIPSIKRGNTSFVRVADLDALELSSRGRPRGEPYAGKSGLVFSNGTLGLDTFGDLPFEMGKAQNIEHAQAFFDDLVGHYNDHLDSSYMGAPQTPPQAALGALGESIKFLPSEEKRELWGSWLHEISERVH